MKVKVHEFISASDDVCYCVWQLQWEVRRSAERYHAACVACDRSKQTLVSIEQATSAAADNAMASFSADKQESLNRATDEVSMTASPFKSSL